MRLVCLQTDRIPHVLPFYILFNTNNLLQQMQRLSQTTKSKLTRGAKAIQDEKWSAKELESKIDIKGLSAGLRREELKLKTQEELAMTNTDKHRRGKLALNVAELEAKQLEDRSVNKIAAVNLRKEKMIQEQQDMLQRSASKKKDKVADVLKQEEEDANKRLAKMEARIKLAEERKLHVEQGKVEGIATQINDKLQRAADVRRKEDVLLQEKSTAMEQKILAANLRRENIIQEQQEMLLKSASKKERMIEQKQRQEEKASQLKNKELQSKLLDANARKEDILAIKTKAVQNDQSMKQARARETWLASLKQGSELKQTSDKRLKEAAERKHKVIL